MWVRTTTVGITLVLALSPAAFATQEPLVVNAGDVVSLDGDDGGRLNPTRLWRTAVTEEPEELTIVFTGDTLIHSSVANTARVADGYDFKPMFAGVRHLIKRADLAICHLEVPLSPTSSGLSSYPLFNAPREVADALAWAGYDGCSTASNHSIDKGVDGIAGTLRVLREAGLSQSGMADDPGSGWEATTYEVDGVRIANISATYWLNGLVMPRDKQHLVQLLDVDQLILVAARARGAGADLVVVSMHCCLEYQQQPTIGQLQIAHELVNSEFIDLVVTHHAHVVSPIERVGDEFIVHGLGNFLSGMHSDPRTSDGVIVHANAGRVGDVWRFTSINVTPTSVTPWSWRVAPAATGSPSYIRTMSTLTSMGAALGDYRAPGLADWQRQLIE
jgi:poly-gamma-glutamate synthesis protein (capsule biosynthesis protein)